MSLKTLHIVFITLSVLLCGGVAFYMFSSFGDDRGAAALILGISAVVIGIVLVWYGIYFLKKLRHVKFL